MYRRGRVFVEGRLLDKGWGKIDVLDLDDTSFRAWLVEEHVRRTNPGALFAPQAVVTPGPMNEYQQRRPEVIRPERPKEQEHA